MKFLSAIPDFVWLIFGFTTLVVLLWIWVKFFFSDENQKRIAENTVKNYFGFLFKYNFSIDTVDANGPNGAWSVILKSENCKIRIIQDRGDIYCELAPPKANEKSYSHLFSIIAKIENKQAELYHPKSNGIHYQLDFYGKLLNSYYEEVIDFMKNSSKYFDTLYQ